MTKKIKIFLIVLGVVSVISAAFGLFYNMTTLWANHSGAFEELTRKENLIYFHQAFYAMSAFCIISYLLLFFFGIAFLKSKTRYVSFFVALLVSEVIYFFLIGSVGWGLKRAGHSIAAASGVANGGLMAQFIILFPIWGSIIALWAKKTIQNTHLTTGSTTDRE
jgi:glucan phosphoethanolaminetransferase (alkaline phosphatase superfamily)